MKVFIHIDSKSTYIGNGGFLVLTNLANELGKLGYETYLFDPKDKITHKKLEWLSLPEKHFRITKSKKILQNRPKDYRLITAWLRTLPEKYRNESLRYLESSELLREGHEPERNFLLKNNIKIANLHKNLTHIYNSLGIRNMINIEVWIRNDVKYYGQEKIKNSVGIQLEKQRFLKIFTRYDWSRYSLFKNKNIIICNGTYQEVIYKMNKADLFIHNPKPSPHIGIFKGETFGLPLFEAMACGCVCIARKHEGIKFLNGIIPLVESMQEAKEILTQLTNNKEEKEEIRNKSLTFIEKNYRFDEERKNAILRWLE